MRKHICLSEFCFFLFNVMVSNPTVSKGNISFLWSSELISLNSQTCRIKHALLTQRKERCVFTFISVLFTIKTEPRELSFS